MSEQQWTAKMSDEVRKAADIILQEGNPGRAFVLHQMVEAIESQRAELEAARELAEAWKLHSSAIETYNKFPGSVAAEANLKACIERIDELVYFGALRNQDATSGEDAE